LRPKWRLFRAVSTKTTTLTVVDKPGSIAIYRVTAVVQGRETDLGSITYYPSK
jgi:hypothetical protein